MSFDTLSNEIIFQIIACVDAELILDSFSFQTDIKQICDQTIHYKRRLRSLYALMLCNRRLHFLLEPYLYSKIVITKLERLVSFAKTISTRCEFASHVRELFLIEDVPSKTHTGNPAYYPQSDYAKQWDSLVNDVFHKLHNLQSFSLERITGRRNSNLQTPLTTHGIAAAQRRDADISSPVSLDHSKALPQNLRHLTLSHKGDANQLLESQPLSSFLELPFAASLHLNRIMSSRVIPTTASPESLDILSSSLRELRLTSCRSDINKLASLLCSLPHLERFSYQFAAFEQFGFNLKLEDLLGSLLPRRHTLKELRISAEETGSPSVIVNSEDEKLLSYLSQFSSLVSLSLDATMLRATSKFTPHLGHRFLSSAVQPSITHLTIYQSDFVTYERVQNLILAKPKPALALNTITLQFHPDFPHWPSVVDPVNSLVGAEIREHLAAQTKVIEREYVGLSETQTFSSTPVSWLKPLPKSLVPHKELAARTVCEASGIALVLQRFDPFKEARDMRNTWRQRNHAVPVSFQGD